MNQGGKQQQKATQPRPLIREFPELAEQLEVALHNRSEQKLAQTVAELRVYGKEASGVSTTPKQPGALRMWRALIRGDPAWGKTHRNIELDELDVVLDIVGERIAFIEFLDPKRWLPAQT